jgi:hypothetical protein
VCISKSAPPVEDTSQNIIVTRVSDGTILAYGDNYVAGESLLLELPVSSNNEYIWQVNVDSLTGCTFSKYGFTRTSKDNGGSPTITAPTDGTDLVITAGWAPSHSSKVRHFHLSRDCLISLHSSICFNYFQIHVNVMRLGVNGLSGNPAPETPVKNSAMGGRLLTTRNIMMSLALSTAAASVGLIQFLS